MYRTLLLATALLAACGDEPMTVVTYNVGLAPGVVDGAESRAPMVAEAVAALEADVLCLQELWTDEHIQIMKDATANTFPEQRYLEPNPVTLVEPGCTSDELDSFVGCVEGHCEGGCDEFLDDCTRRECWLPYLGLSKACQGCVTANAGEGPEAVRAACAEGYPVYAYDGAFGTAVLGKHPILSSDHLTLESTIIRRGVLHAVIDGPAGLVDVYCTQLPGVSKQVPPLATTSSGPKLPPSSREERDQEPEQQAQARAVVAYVSSSAETDRVVLMGDFNAGPQVGASVAVQPLTYEILDNVGDAPYVREERPCTWCPSNALIDGASPNVIDHVFVGGFEGRTSSTRLLSHEIDIQVCGETVIGAYSDHYAVSVTIAP